MAVDIITLQEARDLAFNERRNEVQKDAYDEWFRPGACQCMLACVVFGAAGPSCWRQAMRASSSRRKGNPSSTAANTQQKV